MLLDPALRREWLSWAKERSIASIFVAPHASNVPLLGGGWGSAREAAFCEFIRQAAAQGLAVHVSPPVSEGDIDFIQKCSSAAKTDDAAVPSGDATEARTTAPIAVLNSSRLPASLAADRTVLGAGYKPWAVRLGNGDVLVVSFTGGDIENPKTHKKVKFEYAMFWRSQDGGGSWTAQPRPDLPGREFSASVLSDGTLLLPNVLPKNYLNSRNASDMNHVTSSRLFRSTDQGFTFELLPRFDACAGTPHGKGAPCPEQTGSDWTAVELPPTAMSSPGSVRLAIGVCSSAESRLGRPGSPPSTVSLLHSTDSGRTWLDKKQPVDTKLWSDDDGFFDQSATIRLRSGRWLHAIRADTGPGKFSKADDCFDGMQLWSSDDEGRSFACETAPPCDPQAGRTPRCMHNHTQCVGKGLRTFGAIGEMYPRFTELADGRILLTYTVRCGATVFAPGQPKLCNGTVDGHGIGMRALLSSDAEGLEWDFATDRIVLREQEALPAMLEPSGGGFGTTVELPGPAGVSSLLSVGSFKGWNASCDAACRKECAGSEAHMEKPQCIVDAVEVIRWSLPTTETLNPEAGVQR